MSNADTIHGIQSPTTLQDVESSRSSMLSPYRHEQLISWGDCDPAQIAYTANIPSWGLLAIEGWYSQCIGANWFQLNLNNGIGTPFVSLGFDFKSPITPEFPLLTTVRVSKIGNTSLGHQIEGFQNNILCYVGTTTAAFVESTTMSPISIPPNIRARIEAYKEIQDL